MSGQIPALTRTFSVGKFRCVVSIPKVEIGRAASAVIEWWPYTPKRLTPAELDQYRQGRDAAISELAALTGLTAAVVEI